MKRFFSMALFLLLSISAAEAQFGVTTEFRRGPSLPLSCTPSRGDVFTLTSAGPIGEPYYCDAPNHWTSFRVAFSLAAPYIDWNGTGGASIMNKPQLALNTTSTLHQVFNSYNSTTGAFGKVQLACGDLSDSGTMCTSSATMPANTTSTLHQFLNSYNSTTGVFGKAQPDFSDLSGNIAVSQMGSGTGASSSTFWRGDGIWATPSSSGTVNSGTAGQLSYYSATGTAVSSAGGTNVTAAGKITGAGVVDGLTTVTFSATPVFDASATNGFKLTLTGNVTSSTITNAVAGQTLIFVVCQDATGARTLSWPTGFQAAGTITPTANVCSMQTFKYDGTNYYAIGPMTDTGTNGGIQLTEGTCADLSPAAGNGTLCQKSSTHRLTMNNNGAGDAQVVGAGVDINNSDQVISTHLTSPLPVAQGGNGTASPGIVAGTGISVTGSWPTQTVTATGGGGGDYVSLFNSKASYWWMPDGNGSFRGTYSVSTNLVNGTCTLAKAGITSTTPQGTSTTTGTTAGNSCAWNSGQYFVWLGRVIHLSVYESLGQSADTLAWIGMADSNISNVQDPGSGHYGALFLTCNDTGASCTTDTTNWQCLTRDKANGVTQTDSGVAVDTAEHLFEIDITTGGAITYKIDGTQVCAANTRTLTTGQGMYPFQSVYTWTTSAVSMTGYGTQVVTDWK